MTKQIKLIDSYQKLVECQEIEDNEAQRQVLVLLQDILDKLLAPSKKSLFSLIKSDDDIKGIYIYGDVGRGKSMIMDLFFNVIPENHKYIKKRRIHFHAFMQEVHSRIHKLRKKHMEDPVAKLAEEIAQETNLLCFDELQATDVTDATLLYRLFEGMFAGGVCVVSTSNRPPEELYTGGVQAERFDKFISLIKDRMRVENLSSNRDYRYDDVDDKLEFFHYPLGEYADRFISNMFAKLQISGEAKKETIIVHGRKVVFDYYDDRVGVFTFHELCGQMLGAADYLAIAGWLDTIFITAIPKLSKEQRNEAKRFVTLIDALYEHKVRLICTAEVPPEEIYNDGDGSFEFKRTVSRIVEMVG
ncbi:MAG: cell division protein ZapE [Rickettsiales bacterium]